MNQKFRLTKMPFYFFSNWKLWSDLCNSYFVKHCNAFKINSINEAYLCASVFERNLYVALLLQGDQNQIWFLIVVCVNIKWFLNPHEYKFVNLKCDLAMTF